MGNDSEQLVLDYLSRVGDLAHGTSMTAAERAELVGRLRTSIEQRRTGAGGVETAASVRKILKGLGKPEEVVASASGSDLAVPQPRPSDQSSTATTGSATRGLRARFLGGRATGGGREGAAGDAPEAPSAESVEAQQRVPTTGYGAGFPVDGSRPPHLAGMDELTKAESDPQWWRNDPSPYAKGEGGEVDGFVGGIEIPEMLKPPGKEDAEAADVPPLLPGQPGAPAVEQEPVVSSEVPPKTGLLQRLRAGGGTSAGIRRAGGVVELGAVLALVAGAVLGSLWVLGLGWLMAWWSPRLSRNEAKWAAAGMPGLVVTAALVWLWGRTEERWGEPIADGAMGEVMNESYPWVLRSAAAASALFLLWRARRPR